MSETLREELARIDTELAALEKRKREIYRQSLSAPEEEKVGDDDIMAEICAEEPWPSMTWPRTVTGLAWGDGEAFRAARPGLSDWVAVRPCEEEFGGKTYLGVMIGDIALSVMARYDRESGVMSITPGMLNPAIWIPEKRAVVFGCGSWWRRIKTQEDMGQISDADINNVWYVRAMRDLGGAT